MKASESECCCAAATERERASSSRLMRDASTTRSEWTWERGGLGELEEVRVRRAATSLESFSVVDLCECVRERGSEGGREGGRDGGREGGRGGREGEREGGRERVSVCVREIEREPRTVHHFTHLTALQWVVMSLWQSLRLSRQEAALCRDCCSSRR